MIKTKTSFRMAMLTGAALILAGCGGDSKSGTGTLSMWMTDAPVDDAYAVVIAMTEFEFKPVDGQAFRVAVSEAGRELNLLAFTNGETALIIDGEEVPAGDYEWLRIFFDEDASYVQLDEGGGQYPLFIPSGAQTGYKLVSGFTVPVNDSVEYILDFNVRQSLLAPPGLGGPLGEDQVYLLKPTVRIMNAAETGGVWGIVADDLLAMNNDEATCAGGDAVYAFEGAGVDPLGEGVLPLVSDVVDLNETEGWHEYQLAFLLPGDYTLAFTCSASADDGVVETYPLEGLEFSETINVTVVEAEHKQCDIPPADGQTDPC
jgi:hypothetical protein